MTRPALALVLALLGCESAPEVVDLELLQTVPAAIDVTEARDTVLFVRAKNICADPIVTLDGTPYGGAKAVSAGGVLLAGGDVLFHTLDAARPGWRTACDLTLKVKLAVDCGLGTPAFPGARSLVYGVADASLELPITLSGRLDLTPLPQGEDVSPYDAPHVAVPGTASLHSGLLAIDGLTFTEGSFARDDAEVVTWAPPAPFTPNATYAASLRGGSEGLRSATGRCLGQDLHWWFRIRAAGAPPFRAGWQQRNQRWVLAWEDLGGATFSVVRLPFGEQSVDVGLDPHATSFEPPDDECYRVHARAFDGTELASDELCPEDHP